MVAPCTGLRVLDLSWGPAGGIATMVLADFGAEVLKVEPPGGDPFRRLAAAPMWLRGKRSIVLDLKTSTGVEKLHALVPRVDVLVTTYRPGTASRLGADYQTVSAINPRLVYCSITGFGPTGPYSRYKGYEGIVAAKSGRMMVFAGQNPRPGPAYAAVQVGTHAAAQAAVHGILAALLVREQTGRGQLVETSLLQGMLPYDMSGLLTEQLRRKFPDQFPDDALTAYNRQFPRPQYQPALTKDGRWIQLGNLVDHLFHAYLAAAGLTHIYADPQFQGMPRLPYEARVALQTLMLERMRERTLDEWMELFIATGNIAAEPVASTQEALTHPQVVHNQDVVEIEHPRYGRMKQIGLVAKLLKTPGKISSHSPEVGEDTALVLSSSRLPVPLSRSTGEGPEVRAVSITNSVPANSGPPRHPLAGVTILEFATIIAVPLACALLADLGARVIKVEPPGGDGIRELDPGVLATKTTAGKESICIDLKTVAGRRIARQLIEQAAVLVHNYRPGVPERLGIGYEEVRQYNPKIVYVSATGYGSDGPSAHRPSTHPIAGAAMGGALWQAGAGWPPPDLSTIDDIREASRRFLRANEVNPDPNASLVIATAILLGLYAQRIQGIGQHIQTNMLIANAYANFDDFLSYPDKPPRPPVDPDLYGLHALYRLYPAAEGWVFLACLFEEEWQRLCHVLGHPELLHDTRFCDEEARRVHDADLAAVLAAIFQGKTADAWEELLTGHDLACVRADRHTPGSFWDSDKHVRQNGFTREAEHPHWGRYQRHGPVVSFRETPGWYGPGILAGQHTDQLLRELGYSSAEINDLRAAGVVS